MTVEVADGASRYEAFVDGAMAGFAMYRVEDGGTVFFHTRSLGPTSPTGSP